MADPIIPIADTTLLPQTGVRLSKLPDAQAPAATDYLWSSQFLPALGRYQSRRMTFDQIRQFSRPACVVVTAAHSGTTAEGGYYLDPTRGDFTLTLTALGDVADHELPVIHVGASGTATLAAHPGEVLVLPGGRTTTAFALRPGETIRLRAVVVPAPALSGWYLVGV